MFPDTTVNFVSSETDNKRCSFHYLPIIIITVLLDFEYDVCEKQIPSIKLTKNTCQNQT